MNSVNVTVFFSPRGINLDKYLPTIGTRYQATDYRDAIREFVTDFLCVANEDTGELARATNILEWDAERKKYLL